MEGVLTGFSVIGVAILVGYLLGRAGVLGAHGHLALNRMSFYAATPALLFSVLARSDIGLIASPHMAIAVLAFAAAAGSYLVISRLLRRPFEETVVGMAASGFSNSNNIGLPLTLYVLGDVHYAAIILLMQATLVTPTFLTALSHASGERTSARSIAAGVATNPIIIAAALGLVVAASNFTVPDPFMAPIDLVADAAIPVVLIAFGVSLVGLRGSGDRADLAPVAIASGMKLVVMPLAAYLAATLIFGLKGVPLFAAVLCATLPTGQMVFSYAARYGVAVPLARDTAAVTTIACIPMVLLVTLLLG